MSYALSVCLFLDIEPLYYVEMIQMTHSYKHVYITHEYNRIYNVKT